MLPTQLRQKGATFSSSAYPAPDLLDRARFLRRFHGAEPGPEAEALLTMKDVRDEMGYMKPPQRRTHQVRAFPLTPPERPTLPELCKAASFLSEKINEEAIGETKARPLLPHDGREADGERYFKENVGVWKL